MSEHLMIVSTIPLNRRYAMPPTKSGAAKKATAKQASKKATAKQPTNQGLMKAVQPSAELAAIVGNQPLPRTEITKRIWAYIKDHGLQDAQNKRMINADTKLQPLFGRQKQVSMLELPKLVSRHVQ
jgi:chromatin remodeling complex protein RSC6